MSFFKQKIRSFFQSSPSLDPYRLYSHADYSQLPVINLVKLSSKSIARQTGPDLGLQELDPKWSEWQNADPQLAYGQSISLYDRNPSTGIPNGDPIADCFAISVQENNAFLMIADGVNWGVKARLAARCAIYAAMKSLHETVFQSKMRTSKNVFQCLRSAIDAAQRLIVEREGTLTTFTISIVCPCGDRSSVICTAIVGDSNAYLYRRRENVVLELTEDSRRSDEERDMRYPGGVLGTTMTEEADLCNLTYSIIIVEEGDFLFLTTDGISDNYDPYVNRLILSISPPERHRETLNHLQRTIHPHRSSLTAAKLSHCLIDEVIRMTDEQRYFVEDNLRRTLEMNIEEKKRLELEMLEQLKKLPGKLDHASIVVYQIAFIGHEERKK